MSEVFVLDRTAISRADVLLQVGRFLDRIQAKPILPRAKLKLVWSQ